MGAVPEAHKQSHGQEHQGHRFDPKEEEVGSKLFGPIELMHWSQIPNAHPTSVKTPGEIYFEIHSQAAKKQQNKQRPVGVMQWNHRKSKVVSRM